MPAERNLQTGRACGSAHRQHGRHRGSQGRRCVAEMRGQQDQQIVRRGTQRAGAGQRGEVPVRHALAPIVVSGGEPLLQRIGQRDGGARHPQRPGDPRADERFVVHAGAACQQVSQQPRAEIRVLVSRADVAGRLVRGKKRIELRHRVVGVRIARIFRRKIRRQPRQPRRVRREIFERDRLSTTLRHLDVGREVLRCRIRERHLAAPDGIGKQQRSEDLRRRTDLEHRFAVHGVRRLCVPAAVGHHPAAPRVDEADDDPDALVLDVDPVDEHAADLRIGSDRRRRG